MASYDYGKNEITAWIRENFRQGDTCLDVGACDGKWGRALCDWLAVDAVEVWEPNVNVHNLREIYRDVYVQDIRDMTYEWYDLIIFGDVIEHLTPDEARAVIEYARPRCSDMIIAVPWRYVQGAIYGNPYEIHKQDDLTPAIFAERYKGMKELLMFDTYGYYHKARRKARRSPAIKK